MNMQQTEQFLGSQTRKFFTKNNQIQNENKKTHPLVQNFFKEQIQPKKKQIQTNKNKNDPNERSEDKEKRQGYEVSVKITKENSFDVSYQDKLIQFIKKFYFNGHFQLSLYLPHTLGQSQLDELQEEFQDLQFQMKEIQFDESDYLFYQKIYQFKGQEKFGISADLQMLIFDQSIFQELESKARKQGYHFQCNFQTLQCSIPTPNNTLHDIKKQMQYFVNNVQNTLDKYDIIVVDTKTKQESKIIYKLVKKLQTQISQELYTNIFPVIINLNNLKESPKKYIDNNFIKKINQTLKYDKLYLVVEKNNQDLNIIQQEYKKFMNSRYNIIYFKQDKVIKFKEAQDSEYLAQELEKLKQQFQNISIIISEPKKVDRKFFEVDVSFESWYDTQSEQPDFEEDCNKIYSLITKIYNPYVKITMKDISKFMIWQQYLKGKQDISLKEHIIEDHELSNQKDFQNKFVIRILANHPQYKEEKKNIKKNLENLKLQEFIIENNNQQIKRLASLNLHIDEFETLLNNFQKQENEKIAQIKLIQLSDEKIKFKVIFYLKHSSNEIEEIIKRLFVDTLSLKYIDLPFISIIKYLKLETPKKIQDKDILSVIPKENKQQVIIIGKNQDLQKFENINLKEIDKIYKDNRMKIQLFIKQKSLSDEISKILIQQDCCNVSYDQRKYIQTIEFLKQHFEIIYNLLKNLEQSYDICKVLILDVNDQKKIEKINLKEIEKKEQVIIDIQSVSIINPLTAKGFLLNIGYNKQIKFIKGNISQIQCQAIVLEFLKNVDFSEERLQNDQIKNIINFIQGENNKKELLQQWKHQSQEQDIEDIHCKKLENHKNQIEYLFQIYPKFNRQAANLGNNLSHISSLITQVFQQSKEHNITQIAFPLIGVGLFGYSLKDIQQVLIQEIISQLSYQYCQISQVFVVIQNEQDYRKVQEYCKNISNNTNLNQSNYNQQSFISTQVTSCQIEIDGDLIDIENSNVIEQISQKYQIVNQDESFEPFTIPYPYSKYPFTHSIDLKNNKMIQKKTKTQSKIEFIDLFKQRIYFIDQQQVSQSLNQYLVLKHEQSKLNEFEIYYAQDEVKVINSQFYIKTNASENFEKIIIKQKKDTMNSTFRDFPISFQESVQQILQQDQSEQISQQYQQIVILANSEQKIKTIMEQLNLVTSRKSQCRIMKKSNF